MPPPDRKAADKNELVFAGYSMAGAVPPPFPWDVYVHHVFSGPLDWSDKAFNAAYQAICHEAMERPGCADAAADVLAQLSKTNIRRAHDYCWNHPAVEYPSDRPLLPGEDPICDRAGFKLSSELRFFSKALKAPAGSEYSKDVDRIVTLAARAAAPFISQGVRARS